MTLPSIALQDCVEKRGEFVGSACSPHGPYVPDVLFWCVLLFFSTVLMSAFLKEFKFSNYFPTKVLCIIHYHLTSVHYYPNSRQSYNLSLTGLWLCRMVQWYTLVVIYQYCMIKNGKIAK